MPSDSAIDDYGWTKKVPGSTGLLAAPILRHLAATKSKRVLDMGCGNGSLTTLIAQAGHEVVGCDVDAEGVKIAAEAYPDLEFHQYGVYDSPERFADPGFDAMVATEVIEHLYRPSMLVKFAHTVLRPGGHLILTCPYHGYLKNLIISILGKWDMQHTTLLEGMHVKFFSHATMAELLEQNGFEVTYLGGVGRVPYLWRSMVVVAKKP